MEPGLSWLGRRSVVGIAWNSGSLGSHPITTSELCDLVLHLPFHPSFLNSKVEFTIVLCLLHTVGEACSAEMLEVHAVSAGNRKY